MKKRIFAGILIMVFVLASVMGVSAAGSKDGKVSVVEPNSYYIIRTGAEEYTDDSGNDIANKQDILSYNAGTITLEKLLEKASAEVKAAIKDKKDLTGVFDLYPVNGGNPSNDGVHSVALNVPALSDKCSEVIVLHYSFTNGWEILKDSKVDVAKKQVTVVTKDLSPVVILSKVSTGSGTGTSPSTGIESSTWMIWSAVALAVIGAGVVVTRKKRA